MTRSPPHDFSFIFRRVGTVRYQGAGSIQLQTRRSPAATPVRPPIFRGRSFARRSLS